MPDLQPLTPSLPNPVSLPFVDDVPLSLPNSGSNVVNRRRPRLNLRPRPRARLDIIPDLRPPPARLPPAPAVGTAARTAGRSRGALTRLTPAIGRLSGPLNALSLFYDGVSFLESQAPGVHSFLNGGWRGTTEGGSSPRFESGGQCDAVYRLIVRFRRENGSASNTNPNYLIRGPIRFFEPNCDGRGGIGFTSPTAGFPLQVCNIGGEGNIAEWNIVTLDRVDGEPDNCGGFDAGGQENPAPNRPSRPQDQQQTPPISEGEIVPFLPPGNTLELQPPTPGIGLIDDSVPQSEPTSPNHQLAPPENRPQEQDDQDEPDNDPSPSPSPSCADPCLQPIQNGINDVQERLSILDRFGDLVNQLNQNDTFRRINSNLEALRRVVERSDRRLSCLEELYCSPFNGVLEFEDCDSSDSERYAQRLLGIQGIAQLLSMSDEFNQRRFKELCPADSGNEDSNSSLILSATSTLGSQIFDTPVLPEQVRSLRLLITDFWDNRNGTRVFKRDESGRLNGSFGVVSIGYIQEGEAYYLESNNLSFPSLLVEVPRFIADNAVCRLSMPVGTTFQLFDTGQRHS